jgi:[acyl-carrier-protein] S-malonyltransferase
MGYAREGLIKAIADMEMRDPQVPVVANSLAASVTTAQEVRTELVEGLCHCVKWKQSVRYMVDSGASHFMEFGPARVLSSLIKRIDKDVDAFTLSDPTSIEKVTQEI